MTRLPFCVALSLALAGQLAAQDPRLAARLPAGTGAAVQALIDSATKSGLPGEPLVQKALEGESKGADSARIVAAVRSLAGRLGAALRALPSGGEAELVAAAAALRAGATPGDLTRLARLRPGAPLTVPLSVLADLLAAGVGAERAWDSIADLASRGASESAYLELRDRLTGGRGAGPALPPPQGRPPGQPAPGGVR